MRIILGFLSGILGMLAGWFGLAFLIVSISGEGPDGGTAMGAFFEIGPFGGLVGFVLGVVLFLKMGLRRQAAPADFSPAETASVHRKMQVSRPFATLILVIAAALLWWGWYEFIRSPYLTHGDMKVELQFRLPPTVKLPPDRHDVHIAVTDGDRELDANLDDTGWHGHEGGLAVILASVPLSYKTSGRVASLSLPGLPTQIWPLENDPDPASGYTPWHTASGASTPEIEMNYRFSKE